MSRMQFFRLGPDGALISRVILGGHEYLADGRSRGFNEDFEQAVTPGMVMPGFGGPQRRDLVEAALKLGVNCFDVTIDSEKEALGRNLRELAPACDVFIQTRPEGMVYSYDLGNRRLLDRAALRDEVLRILTLLRRDRIDILNFGILQSALDDTPDYLDRLGSNIAELKHEGLIGYAAADSFSGPGTYAAMVASGAFDTININYNIAETWPRTTAIPAARAAGCAVVTREALIKGALFSVAGDLDEGETGALARAAIKQVAATPGVDGLILGAASLRHFSENVSAALKPGLDDAERAILERVTGNAAFRDLKQDKNRLADGGQQ